MTLIVKQFRSVVISLLLSSLVLGYNPPREPVVIQDGVMQWEYDGEDWRYLTPDGNSVVGRFCDSMGDVYYAGADGKLLCEGYLGEEYFGADGRLVNPSAKGADKFKEVVDEFEAGEAVCFKSTDEVVDFMHWYSSQWSMGRHDTNLQAEVSSRTGRVKFTKPREFLYDREAVMRELFERFGRIAPSLSDLEKINTACSKLSDFNYDVTMYQESIHDVLATSSGVCWQFSRIVQCLLEDCGLEVEVVQGLYGDVYHAWLKVKADGRWVYVDPTAFVGGGDAIVSESNYLKNYRVLIQDKKSQ